MRTAELFQAAVACGCLSVCVASCQSNGRPPAAPSSGNGADAHINGLSIAGLPAPLLDDIPPSLKAGRSYPLTALASFADGSTGPLGADAKKSWVSDDPAVASFAGDTLQAHREGALTITLRLTHGTVSTRREVTVRSADARVRETRTARLECGRDPVTCATPFCRQPYWLFPVYGDGTVQILQENNPFWGGAYNRIAQLSRAGEELREWGFPAEAQRPEDRRASVPGGFMYAFWMDGDGCAEKDVAAVWTRPN